MDSKEKLGQGNAEKFDEKALAEHAKQQHERVEKQHERAAERAETNREKAAESARHEIEKATHEKENHVQETHREQSPAERRGPASKHERAASYNKTMREVRSQMSAPSRAFSDFIHNPVVEKVSDTVGGTVARPNAVLSGSISAFMFTLVIYLIARFNGYPLSGAETIASFVAGWLIGILFDYVRLLVFGKK